MCDFAGAKITKKVGNMKKADPKKFVVGLLGFCTVAAIGGAVSSSLAWYAYATRATLMYSGTSVFDNGQLQIGVRSDIPVPTLVNAGMIEEQQNGSYYYFAPAGEGLSSDYLSLYLDAIGYASNELQPVTSGQFNPADANHNSFALLTAPNSEVPHPVAANNPASVKHYSQITFAFKVFTTNDNSQIEYLPNKELWITYVQTRASQDSTGQVSKALRMYIHRDETIYGTNNGFIFNPSVEESGETKVGGLLNLGYDQYYDFDDNGEIVYGDYSIINGTDSGISEGPYTGEEKISDVNNKWEWDEKEATEQNIKDFADTFTAIHSPYAPKYYANLNKLDIKTAKYQGTNYTVQVKENGVLANPEGKKTSVCVTGGESVGYIGEFDATIYL